MGLFTKKHVRIIDDGCEQKTTIGAALFRNIQRKNLRNQYHATRTLRKSPRQEKPQVAPRYEEARKDFINMMLRQGFGRF